MTSVRQRSAIAVKSRAIFSRQASRSRNRAYGTTIGCSFSAAFSVDPNRGG